VTADDSGLSLSGTGVALFDGIRKRAGLWTQFERLAKRFDGLADPGPPTWNPPEPTIAAALDVFHAMAEEVARRNR
jgi:hypothetical protein